MQGETIHMKTNSLLQIAVATAALVLSLATTTAQPANRGAGSILDPRTGLPVTAPAPIAGLPGGPGAPAMIDPTTGLPLGPAPERPWMDENWQDPKKSIEELNYDGLPLIEVAHDLEKQFTNSFDLLLPQAFEGTVPQPSPNESRDLLQTQIFLRMKHVRASEVFNAMNLMFENNRTPLRWELRVTDRRQMALLRVLDRPLLSPGAAAPQPMVKRVYFVGELLGDGKSGGMTMPQVIDTVSSVYKMSYGKAPTGIQFHTDAQLLIFNGTVDQLNLIEQTLEGLKQKVELDRKRAQRLTGRSAEPKSEPGPNAKLPE